MHKSEWFLVVMAIVFFATGVAFLPYLPAQMVSHWSATGQPNGSLPRAWGAFLLPLIFAVIAVIFSIIPRIDPKRENIAKFRKAFDLFLISFSFVFYYIYLLMLEWNIGLMFDFARLIIPPLAALFYVIGMILPETEPNWTIGIRTSWTMSSV